MNRQWRLVKDRAVPWIMRLATLVFVCVFLSVVFSIFVKGFRSLDLELIVTLPSGGFYLGGDGGLLNAIAGSLILSGSATLLALAISLPLALFINIYLKKGSRIATLVRFALDVLWGIPSIVFGACTIAVMLLVGLRYSLLAGIIVVTIIG